MNFDVFVIGDNGLRHESRNADLLDMSVVGKGLLDIDQVGAAAGKDDTAEQLIVILRWDLIPYILDNFF